MARRMCLALDLKDEPSAIAEYDRIHRPGGVWPEVIADLRARGYIGMTIWRTGTRLFMIADIERREPPPVGPAAQRVLDDWQTLTRGLQQALPPHKGPPEWIEMACVFDLEEHQPERPQGAL